MATVRENMSLSLSTSDVPDHRPRRERKAPARSDLSVQHIDRRVVDEALRLADGDPRRIEYLADGSALVHNRPRR